MFKYTVIVFAYALFLIISGITTEAFAQINGATTSSITGKITDPQGASIEGATVTIKEIATNLIRTTQTQTDGSYLILQLSPGVYELSVEDAGFAKKIISNLTLTVGTSSLFSTSLTIKNITDSSDVIEVLSTSALEPNKTEKSIVINQQSIRNLPIDRRNFLTFVINTGGAVIDPLPVGGVQANSNLNFSGQNARQNNVTIDGIDNNDLFSGSVRSTYSQEAVQEFQVVNNSFSSEIGRAQGGVVNIITRSGSNDFRSSLFFINRNDELSARNAFATSKSELSQYQFGSTLGGRIKKDKAFFFAAFERLSFARAINVNIAQNVVDAFNRVGFPVRNGAIDSGEANTTFLSRNDFKLNQNNNLSVRYNYAKSYDGRLEDFGGGRAESAGGVARIRDDSLSFSNTFISPTVNLINETRFLFGRRDFQGEPLDPFGPRVSLGIASAGRSNTLPSRRFEHIYQIVNTTSLVKGRNQIKFGVDYIKVGLPKDSNVMTTGAGGQAFFQSLPLGPFGSLSVLEAFDPSLRSPQQVAALKIISGLLPANAPGFPAIDISPLSLPAFFVQGFGSPNVGFDYNYFSAFFQNDIKITNKLVAKLGVRYDRESLDFIPNNSGNFSPRVALAYQVNEKLNLFGAYGIFHGVTPFSAVLNLGLGTQNNYRVPLIAFPFSVLPFALPGRRFPESTSLPSSINFVRQLSIEQDVQKDFRNGYAQHINIGFNYLIEKNTVFSASYQHVRGLKQFLSRNINPVVRPNGGTLNSLMTGRVDPTRGQIQNLESSGDTYYDALSLEVQRKFGSKLTFLANYTYSKTIDNFIDYRIEFVSFQNPLDLGGERSLSMQDLRNRFVFSGIWNLDYSKNAFLKDFVLSGIFRGESGQPYNLLAGVDLDRNGDNPAADRPNRIGRNAGITPGFKKLDIRLTRKIKFNEKLSLDAFIEAFNALNHTNINGSTFTFFPNADGTFDLPAKENGRFIVPADRRVSSAPARQLQVGFRLSF
jgi:hypothetical protein